MMNEGRGIKSAATFGGFTQEAREMKKVHRPSLHIRGSWEGKGVITRRGVGQQSGSGLLISWGDWEEREPT